MPEKAILLLPELTEDAREGRVEPVVGTVLGCVDGGELGRVILVALHVVLDPGDDEDLCEPLGSGAGAGLERHRGAALDVHPAGGVVQVDGGDEGVGGGDDGEGQLDVLHHAGLVLSEDRRGGEGDDKAVDGPAKSGGEAGEGRPDGGGVEGGHAGQLAHCLFHCTTSDSVQCSVAEIRKLAAALARQLGQEKRRLGPTFSKDCPDCCQPYPWKH